MIRLDDRARPIDRGTCRRVEELDAEPVDGGDVVIAEHRRVRAFAHAREAFVRVRSVADDIAETQHLVGGRDAREDGFERLEVRVNVGDDRESHAFASASSRALAKYARSGSVPTVTRM